MALELNDEEARQLAVVLGGAYGRPKIVDDLELALGELQIEWCPCRRGAGRSDARSRTAPSGDAPVRP
jgi:hypothetical protein